VNALRISSDGSEVKSLHFPASSDPHDLGFRLFAVGMTSQVSRRRGNHVHMRRLTPIHAILNFLFNIAIVALSINIIASVI
jgi:uncharacterized membrane protein